MRILIVNTNHRGGAGIAARRQLEALSAAGHECHFAYLEHDWSGGSWMVREEGPYCVFVVPGERGNYNSALASAYCNENRTPASSTWLSFWPPCLPTDELLISLCAGYDVVHLHWVSHFVSSAVLRALEKSTVRVVLTGHDMNHFTGACHYSAGCTRYRSGCHDCPQLVVDPLSLVHQSFRGKVDAMEPLRASWVFPSRWLADCFRSSALGRVQRDVHVIRNCLDTESFAPCDADRRQQLRASLGARRQDLLLVAGAQDNKEKRKGFELLETSLRAIEPALGGGATGAQAILVTFGSGKPEIRHVSPWLQHLHLEQLDEPAVANLFRAADLMLFPSLEENFSNTILEALMCGCPVLAFDVGGVPDIVVDGANGALARAISPQAFSEALLELTRPRRLAELRESTLRWRESNHRSYSPDVIARQLLELYESAPPEALRTPQEEPPQEASWHSISARALGGDAESLRADVDTLRRFVAAARQEDSVPRRERLPAMLFGFGAPESHDDWGVLQWIRQRACVALRVPAGAWPRLLLQVPNASTPRQLCERSMASLTARFRGRLARVTRVDGDEPDLFLYFVIEPPQDMEALPGPAEFALEFREPVVPLSMDSRGLGMLITSAAVFDAAAEGIVSDLSAAWCRRLAPQIEDPASDDTWTRRRIAASWRDVLRSARVEQSCAS